MIKYSQHSCLSLFSAGLGGVNLFSGSAKAGLHQRLILLHFSVLCMSWVCPYQSCLQPVKGSLSVPVTNSSFFQERWFGAMGNCLLLPRNDDLCEQQSLIHSQGRAVPKAGYVSALLEEFSLYEMVYFIKM